MTTYLHQLPLGLRLQDEALFQNFQVGANQQIVQLLQAFATQPSSDWLFYIYGQTGVGRSHLLQACCHLANQQQKTTFYVSLLNYPEFSPEILEGLESVSLVCIDDIDAIMGQALWEESLFHCYNRVLDHSGKLLLNASCPPKQLSCLLPDLQTRLSSGLVLELVDLEDDEKIQTLKMRARNRGLILTDDVAQFLLRHYSRNMRDLIIVLDRLDHASLIAQRKLTIPFVKSVIG